MTDNNLDSILEILVSSCRTLDGCLVVKTYDIEQSQLSNLKSSLMASGIYIAELDGRVIHDKDSLLMAFKHGFQFPEYFGMNWDALLDCMSDLSWINCVGYCCIIAFSDNMRSNLRETWDTAIDVLKVASARLRDYGVVLKLILV